MKSVLYALLLLLVPDLAALAAGVTRLSTCSTASPLLFEVHARDGCLLVCALRRRNGDRWTDPQMTLLVDVVRQVLRPLEFEANLVHELAGDRCHSIDIDLQLKLSVRLMQWLLAAQRVGHRLDASADRDAQY